CGGMRYHLRRFAFIRIARLQVWHEYRRHTLEHLHRQRRGELECLCRAPWHEGGQGAEVVVAQEEHEGGGTVQRTRADQPAAGTEAFNAVVTSTGFAAHYQWRAVLQLET